MEYYNTYLQHHGIEGQQWGVKNGPPYPLERQKKRKNKVKKSSKKNVIKDDGTKENAIRSGNVKLVKKYAYQMSNNELETALRRIDLMERMDSKTPSNAAFNKINAATKKVETINRAGDAGIKAYNNASAVSNVLFGTNLPRINNGGSNKKKKKNDQNDDD